MRLTEPRLHRLPSPHRLYLAANTTKYASSQCSEHVSLCTTDRSQKPSLTDIRLLVIITPLTYLPQYWRLFTQHSTHGTSIWATFFIALVYQAEIANMYYLFQSAPEQSLPESRFGVPINTPPNLRDWINLAQILMQWTCALFLCERVPPSEFDKKRLTR